MLMLNWVDLVIILLLGGSGYVSSKIGFFRQFCLLVGFFGGLFLAGWLVPYLLPINDPILLIIVNANLVLLIAIYAGMRGFDLGCHIKTSMRKKYRNRIEALFGVLIGGVAMLVVVWLGAVGLTRMPFAGLSNSVNDAYILQQMNSVLPSVPEVFAKFGGVVDHNSPPRVFTGHQPKPTLVTPSLSDELESVASTASESTMRITGFGCGGIVSGSGFVVAPGLVATNAHVVAGVKRPIIKDGGRSYEATPVLFNANLDVAILKAEDLSRPSLLLNPSVLKSGDQVVVLGYPKGNFAAQPGVVVSSTQIFGTNIYGLGTIPREVYDLRFDLNEGNSGGPVLLGDGTVGGIVFARAQGSLNNGYVLTSKRLIPLVEQSKRVNNRKVSTGTCLVSS